ncbi:MAG: hypothetical protein ACJAZ9_000876 [Neolewinella sp.]|jgi:hypothetical protein
MQDYTDALALLRASRANILKQFTPLSSEQVNQIPSGLNNNIIWNAGHVVATMELLIYALSGLKTPSDKEFIDRFRKGSKPEGIVSEADRQLIAERLISSVDQLEEDLATLDFSNFKAYPTSYGITLSSVGDAIAFNNMHEAMHLGTMIVLRKFVD